MTVGEKEYIERDEILRKISKMIEYCKKDYKVNVLTALFQVGDAVIDCKSADVQEVVRCKDCKHLCKDLSGRDMHICMRWPLPRAASLYGYCSDGEKMDGGDDK